MPIIPTDLSERNYTFENWKKMGIALAGIRARVEKSSVDPAQTVAREILGEIEKLEKDTGIKFQ
jgi:hypothetical protein